MTSTIILAVKITTALSVGILSSTAMTKFHNFKFKTKKKGGTNEYNHSELLRERAKRLH